MTDNQADFSTFASDSTKWVFDYFEGTWQVGCKELNYVTAIVKQGMYSN
jgi:hypothetical protein